MHKIIIIIVAMCLLMGISCSHRISEGTIVKKTYEPARTWIQTMPISQRIGKTTIVTMIPITHYDNEDFILSVEGRTDSRETVIECFYVEKTVYDAATIGEYVVFDEKTMLYEDKIETNK